jgi:RNA polymerase sigma factor (sigma-70 family)
MLRRRLRRLIPRIAGFLGVCAGSTLSVAVTPVGPASFAATRWSTVLNAGAGETPEARAALERLCTTYWYPLYANIRRRGYSQEDACDLTQEFFASLLRRRSFASVGPEKGRFRSFLLTSLGYFLVDQAKQRCAVRRGSGKPLIELDALEAEQRYALEPATEETPDKAFDRHWAVQLMDRAVARLETEQAQAGKEEQFARLQPFLAREPEPGEYEALATPLGVTPNAIASAVRRARLRLRELALAEAAETVASPAEAEAELRALLR